MPAQASGRLLKKGEEQQRNKLKQRKLRNLILGLRAVLLPNGVAWTALSHSAS
jgi:hypothetical protein